MADAPEKEEKTEEASPKRLSEAREKGQVAFSTEMMAATGLLGALLSFVVAGPGLLQASGDNVVNGIGLVGAMGTGDLDQGDYISLLRGGADAVMMPFVWLVLPMFLVALLIGYAQVGGVKFAPQAIAPKWNKLDPIAGVKRLFGAKAWMRTGMALLKLVLLAVTVILVVWEDVLLVGNLAGGDMGPLMKAVIGVIGKAIIAAIIVVITLATFDLLFQRSQHMKEMRMTKKEVKDEHKSNEGDPMVKARIRQVQREMAGQRMMEEVPDATVVVTNPTHFAVALRYDQDGGKAPLVVAKGVDEMAQRIKSVARDAEVLLYEDPPLARALHRSCEIGDEVPEDLFQAVAGVLAYVYRVQGGAPVTA